MAIYVAVVVGPEINLDSHRESKDYSCFLGATKDEAIQKALAAKGKWDGYVRSNGEEVKYRVIASKVTSEIIPTYEEEKL